ncbi:hypothetical protein SALBM135S_09166 [Streptomyces alboniger]
MAVVPPTSAFEPSGASSCAVGRSRSLTVASAWSEAGGSERTTEYEAVVRSGFRRGAATLPTPPVSASRSRKAAACGCASGLPEVEVR